MSDNTEQSILGSDDHNKIPTRSELDDSIEDNVSDKIYEQYYNPMLLFLVSLDEGEHVMEEQVFEKVEKDVSEKTKRKYLKKVFEYNPNWCEKIIDINPSAEVFLDDSLERADLNIEPETINQAKDACEELAARFKDIYIEYHIEEIKKEAEQKLDDPIPERGEVRVDKHNRFIEHFGKIVARKLPDELDSFEQSITKIAGEANEKITIRCLESIGLQESNEFENIAADAGSDNNPGDLRIFTKVSTAEPVNIEVKSTSNRERGGAGLSRLDNPSILFGYFDDQGELAGNAEELIGESIAVYAQPETLQEMATKNQEAHQLTTSSDYTERSDDWLYFRSNVVFADDMKHYYAHGKLPEREVGHELKYI